MQGDDAHGAKMCQCHYEQGLSNGVESEVDLVPKT